MRQLIKNIIQWGEDRNFYGEGGATIESQTLKFFEEYGEYCGNKLRGKDVKDDIGDMAVVCIHLIKLQQKEAFIYYMVNSEPSINSTRIATELEMGLFYSVFFNLKRLAIDNGTTLEECLEVAYNDIKDRKGKFIDGAFIKESDLL